MLRRRPFGAAKAAPYLYNVDGGFVGGVNFADSGGVEDAVGAEVGDEGVGVLGRDRDQQAARCLRVKEKCAALGGDIAFVVHHAFGEFAVGLESAGDELGADTFDGSGKKHDSLGEEAQADRRTEGHFAGVTDDAETGDVGHGVGVVLERDFAGGLVERGHGYGGGVDPRGLGLGLLDGGGDDAGADGLGEDQCVAGTRGGVGKDARGIDGSGDGVTEFEFGIADAVAANDGASGLNHFAEASGEDLFEDLGVTLFGEANHGERRDGATAHGIDIAESVGGGDLSEGEWVVDDGCEEVDGLDESERRRDKVDSGVVGFVEANQDIRVLLPG